MKHILLLLSIASLLVAVLVIIAGFLIMDFSLIFQVCLVISLMPALPLISPVNSSRCFRKKFLRNSIVFLILCNLLVLNAFLMLFPSCTSVHPLLMKRL